MGLERRRLLLAIATVMAVATLVYLNSLQNGFALDDVGIIESNEQVHGFEHLGDALTGPYWPGGSAERGLYRPLTLASYAVNWEVSDGEPFAFHTVNILLHAAVSALVLLLLLNLGVELAAAWAGALVFAVHPVHVEAVANVVGRAEILVALFLLLACVVYIRRSPVRGWGSALVIGGLYFLGLVSKENAVVLPGVLVLYHLYEQVRERPAALGARSGSAREPVRTMVRAVMASWRVYAALGVSLIAYFVIRKINIGVFLGTESPPWYYGLPEHVRILTAIRVWPEYLRLMIVPFDLVPDYGPGVIVPETSLFSPLVILGLLTAVVVALVGWRARRSLPLISAGILFFAITALPVMGILFPVGVILAERTLYLPSVSVAMAVAALMSWAWRPSVRTARRASVLILLVLVVAAGLRTWTASPTWASTLSVVRHLLRHHPVNYRAQWALSSSLREAGDTAAALEHLELAVRMAPGYYNLRLDYGQLLAAAGEHDRAVGELGVALDVVPAGRGARVELMSLHMARAEPDAALDVGMRGLRWHSDDRVFLAMLARAFARAGRFEEAVDARRRSIELASHVASWAEWAHLAGVANLAGNADVAANALDRARELAPPEIRSSLLSDYGAVLEADGPAAVPLW